ncbi:hypothetical protein Ppa06_61030 [Planomonospora parontospora subsp. parontospora]|uniref:Lipoprotein n=2 Tax=Planomonospora parontospora TaxID=58119 RepID=A0AA37F3X6_9ACTN|nr:hypothetical protein [Planomonospora parontospora]GGK62074.1 hypothetical protein GCM10010126_21830 [Planomonospora parontospora]GII12305.1 hypothetical protein Ppa06_61030 [Planomonospora parontospora subsp. parontospora]
MPRSSRSPAVRLGVTLLMAALAVAGCGEREPTAAEAGATLKTHILKLLDEVSAQNVQVTDPGGKDIPCGDGKAKRTFAATAPDSYQGSAPYTLNVMMISTLGDIADYKITESTGAIVHMENEPTRTVVILESAKGRYSARGETQCLSRS